MLDGIAARKTSTSSFGFPIGLRIAIALRNDLSALLVRYGNIAHKAFDQRGFAPRSFLSRRTYRAVGQFKDHSAGC
jgi:hypothetical protein